MNPGFRTFTVPMRTGDPLLVAYNRYQGNGRPLALRLGVDGDPDPTRKPFFIAFDMRPSNRREALPTYLMVQMVNPLAFLVQLYDLAHVASYFTMPARLAQERGLIEATAPIWFPHISFSIDDDRKRVAPSIVLTGHHEACAGVVFGPVLRIWLPERLPSHRVSSHELEHERLQLIDPFEYWEVHSRWLNEHIDEIPLAPRWKAISAVDLEHDYGVFQGPAGTHHQQAELVRRAVAALNRPDLVADMRIVRRSVIGFRDGEFTASLPDQPPTPFPGCRLNVVATTASKSRRNWNSARYSDWLRWSMATERLVELVLATRSSRIPVYCLFWIVEWLPFGFITPQHRVVAFLEQVVESVKRVERSRVVRATRQTIE